MIIIKQGESCKFVGELKDDNGNGINLSIYDNIQILIQSPGEHRVLLDRNDGDFKIIDNRLEFELTAIQTAKMGRIARIEAKFVKNGTVIGQAENDIVIKETLIGKL